MFTSWTVNAFVWLIFSAFWDVAGTRSLVPDFSLSRLAKSLFELTWMLINDILRRIVSSEKCGYGLFGKCIQKKLAHEPSRAQKCEEIGTCLVLFLWNTYGTLFPFLFQLLPPIWVLQTVLKCVNSKSIFWNEHFRDDMKQ